MTARLQLINIIIIINYTSQLMINVTPTVPATQRHLQMVYKHAGSEITAAVQVSLVLTAIFEMLQC